MIKLIASDMDGTLLTSSKNLNPNFNNIIKKLHNEGIIFAPTSGRNLESLRKIFKDVEGDLLYISDNGNYITYKGEVLFKSTLDNDSIKKMSKLIRTFKGCRVTYSNEKHMYTESILTFVLGKLRSYSNIFTKDVSKVNDDIIKCTLFVHHNDPDYIYNTLLEALPHLHVIKSGSRTIDITSTGSNKGVALERIKSMFNIDYNEVMVFGDYLNDLEMMDVAYYSYAMENAHADLKKKARFIAKSNNDNGVLLAIEDVLSSSEATNN